MGDKLGGGGSGEAGFYRRGLPNRPLKAEGTDDPKAFIKVATDMQIGAEKTIGDNAVWDIHQDEVDGMKNEYLDRGKRLGLKVLEDDLEKAMHDMSNSRENIVRHIALAQAYLALTEGENEDHLETPKED